MAVHHGGKVGKAGKTLLRTHLQNLQRVKLEQH